MAGSFQTDPGHSNERLQPLRVAMRKEHLFGAAQELVEDLSSWTLESADEDSMTLVCIRSGGLLGDVQKIALDRIEEGEDRSGRVARRGVT